MFVRGESAELCSIRENPVSMPDESIVADAGRDLLIESE